MQREWLRTKDHPAANGKLADPLDRQWNIDFESDTGRQFRIHVGPTSRLEILRALEGRHPEALAELIIEYVETHHAVMFQDSEKPRLLALINGTVSTAPQEDSDAG